MDEIKAEVSAKIERAKFEVNCDTFMDPSLKPGLYKDLNALLHFVNNNFDDTNLFTKLQEKIHTLIEKYYRLANVILRPLTELTIEIQKIQDHFQESLSSEYSCRFK